MVSLTKLSLNFVELLVRIDGIKKLNLKISSPHQ